MYEQFTQSMRSTPDERTKFTNQAQLSGHMLRRVTSQAFVPQTPELFPSTNTIAYLLIHYLDAYSIMSARNKRLLSTLQQTYGSIMGTEWNQIPSLHAVNLFNSLDLLAKTKPHLNDNDFPNRPSLVQNLHQIAFLAESFTEKRPRSTGSWGHLADNLDQEGLRVFFFSANSLLSLIQIRSC